MWTHRHRSRHETRLKDGVMQAGLDAVTRFLERILGWLSHWGGLLRERAGRRDVVTGRVACVACLMAENALDNPA